MTNPAAPMSWCMPYGQLAWLNQASPALARKFFNAPTSFVVGGSPVPGLGATVVPLFASIHDYNWAGATMMGSKFPWVCYDPENWAQTFEIEKRHLALALWVFADLAHARGQKVIAAPSRDIIYAKATDTPWQWPETIDDGYLRVGIPLMAGGSGGVGAADVFIVQSQGAEKDTTEFASLVSGADKQTNPAQTLWAELTTNLATGAQMRAAYDAGMASGAVISGFWVTIGSQAQVPTAIDFFNTF